MSLVGAVANRNVSCLNLLLTKDEHVRNTVKGASLTNLIADLLVTVVHLNANTSGCKLIGNLMSIRARLLGDRKDLNLAWAQPDRELAFVILGQNTNEALEGTKASAVNHDWLLLGAIGVNVLKLEVVRQLEVKLDGTALPRTTKAVGQMEVNLRTVERTVTLVDHVIDAHRLKCIAQALFSALPILIRTHRILWARRKLNAIWEAKLCIVSGNEVRCIRDLLSNLIRADKEVCVVLSKLTNTEQTVQSTLHLITVIKTSLSQLHRKIPIRTWLGFIN